MNPSLISRASLRALALLAAASVFGFGASGCIGEASSDEGIESSEQGVSGDGEGSEGGQGRGGHANHFLRSTTELEPGATVSGPHPEPWTDRAARPSDMHSAK